MNVMLSTRLDAGTECHDAHHNKMAHRNSSPVLVAILVSGVSGYLAIDLLLRFVRTRSYLPFVVYRVAFGAGVIALVVARG